MKVKQEQRWFAADYLKPSGIANCDRLVDNMKEFQDLIWETPADQMMLKYCKYLFCFCVLHLSFFLFLILCVP